MLKISVLASLFSLLSVSTFAKTLSCEVTEYADGTVTSQKLVTTPSQGDTHGGLLTFKGQTFPDISGMVALIANEGKDFAVLSLYHEKLGTNSSGQYQMVVNEQYAQLQLVIPSESQQMNVVQIICQFYL